MKLSAYNKLVDDRFKVESDIDNLVYLIVSRPEYFEQAVIPHIKSEQYVGDPVDSGPDFVKFFFCFRVINVNYQGFFVKGFLVQTFRFFRFKVGLIVIILHTFYHTLLTK